jgi:hypothetical protein
MIIDGHGHACGDYLTSGSVTNYLERNKVDYVVLVPGQEGSTKTFKFKEKQYTPNKEILDPTNRLIRFAIGVTNSKKHIPYGNQHIRKLKIENGKIKQFYWAIRKNDIQSIQHDYREMSFDGIKMHQCWERNDLNGEWFHDLIDFLLFADIPLFIHLSSEVDINGIINVIKNNKKLKVIIAHCYGIEKIASIGINYLENTYFDVSNNYFVPKKRIENNFSILGSTKFTLGSDTPYGQDALKLTIERICSLRIKENEIDNILGLNLKKLLKI